MLLFSHSAASWKTKPLAARRARRGLSDSPKSSSSLKSTAPLSGGMSPAATFRRVLFPQPDGPMMTVLVPSGKAIVSPLSASYPPVVTVTSRSARSGVRGLPHGIRSLRHSRSG